MVGVVQANGDELRCARDRVAIAGFAFDERQLVGFDLGNFGQCSVAQLVGANVLDHTAQVTQLAVGVNEAGFFFARVAVANQFHSEYLSKNKKNCAVHINK